MPIYEYECENCGKRFEKIQSMTAEPLTECIHCNSGPIRRVLHPVGIIFKGSGWYINDSRKSGSTGGSSSEKVEKGESTAKSESSESSSASKDTSPPASSEK